MEEGIYQIEYVGSCLKLNSLAQRIENYCHSANATCLRIDPLPEGSAKLFNRYYLISDGPRKPLRINFNAHFAAHLFPKLMPPEKG